VEPTPVEGSSPFRGMTAVATPPEGPRTERRSSGLLRVPFVRRCNLNYDDGRTSSAFIVNINVLGAYVARDDVPLAAPGQPGRRRGKGPTLEAPAIAPAPGEPMPELGQLVHCRFELPERACAVAVDGIVSWLNPKQQHPVHSLPPGFGIKFHGLSLDAHTCIRELVEEYLARHPGAR
jgi:PilZ domain-containing protein